MTDEIEVVVLSRADFERLERVLENPPLPSPALLELAARYNRWVDEGQVASGG